MGFAVGGVMLAVIIVAILVIHRNQNNKAVAFDKGPGGSASAVDVNGAPADSAAPVDSSPAAQHWLALPADPRAPWKLLAA